jgi:hypothetical protein
VGVGDGLYLAGTGLQLLAFSHGMRPTTLGVALVLYGLGLIVAARRWG